MLEDKNNEIIKQALFFIEELEACINIVNYKYITK